MITAINWKKSGRSVFEPESGLLMPEHGHNPADWISLLANRRGKLPAARVDALAKKLAATWGAYISDKPETVFSEEAPKSIAVAQLHTKTEGDAASIQTRIDQLATRFTAILNNHTLSIEEKFVLTCECYPQMPVEGVTHSAKGGISVGDFNGLPILAVIHNQNKVPALLLKGYFAPKSVLLIGHADKANEQLPQVSSKRIEFGMRVQREFKGSFEATLSCRGALIAISKHIEGLWGIENPIPAGEIYAGPNHTSILATAKRVVLALSGYTHSPLRVPLNVAAARLATLIDQPDLVLTGTENPFRQRSHTVENAKGQKTTINIPPTFQRIPHVHGGFPHEDAIHVSDSLTLADATLILGLISTPVLN